MQTQRAPQPNPSGQVKWNCQPEPKQCSGPTDGIFSLDLPHKLLAWQQSIGEVQNLAIGPPRLRPLQKHRAFPRLNPPPPPQHRFFGNAQSHPCRSPPAFAPPAAGHPSLAKIASVWSAAYLTSVLVFKSPANSSHVTLDKLTEAYSIAWADWHRPNPSTW